MKFLCDNCKAKYQIPDEKIQGRTLRMKCRKCDHDIIIRGEAGEERPKTMAPSAALSIPASVMPTSASAIPAAARSRSSGTGVPPRTTNALGADFQRRVTTGAADSRAERRPEVVELWHVAINDVPVGPIRREELAKKVGTGEVNGESLCWREGFDDWRPVREVSDLASLLDQRRPPVIRPSGEHSSSDLRVSMDPIGGRHGAAAASVPDEDEQGDNEATIVGPSPLLREMQERDERERAERERHQKASAVAAAAASARAKSEISVKTQAPKAAPAAPEPYSRDSVPAPKGAHANTFDSYAPPARKRRPLSPPVWIAIAGAVGFGMMLAFLLVDRVVLAPRVPQVVQAPVQQAAAQTAPIARTDLETEVEGEVADPSAAPAAPVAAHVRPTNGAPHAANGQTHTNTTPTAQNLTPEQRALIERMGGSTNERPPTTSLIVPTTPQETSAGQAHGPLSASDLGAVVNRNKIQLQRCHERALRGMSSAPAVRMDVSLRVSAAGTVTTASAAGSDFGGLKSCIEQTVRRWRFPESTGGGETRFPVVFQAIN